MRSLLRASPSWRAPGRGRAIPPPAARAGADPPPRGAVWGVTRAFSWQDGERLIRFGRGALADAPALLDEPYTLLTTERAAALAPDVEAGAEHVRQVGPGRVDELAGALLDDLPAAALLVALGGGRIIDVAKALAA